MTNACILTIGDEILLGQITDTNAQFIAHSLSSIGIQVVAKLTVGDTRQDVWDGLSFAFQKADVVVVTGGLGPTKDDLTKKILADWFQSPLLVSEIALEHLEALLRKRGREINALTRTQAEQPQKAEYLKNEVGTAPGMWFSENGKICIALPGVPYEMKQILMDEAIPRLKGRMKLDVILHQFIRTIGVPESTVAEKIEVWEDALPPYLKLAYLPGGGHVKLRLTARGTDAEMLKRELAEQTSLVLPLISEHVYATEDVDLEAIVGGLILKHGIQLKVNDEITEGALFQKFQAFPLIQKMWISSENEGTTCSNPDLRTAKISMEFDEQTGNQHLEAELGELKRELDLKPFLYRPLNQNVVSLSALNLLRKIILEKWPESKGRD